MPYHHHHIKQWLEHWSRRAELLLASEVRWTDTERSFLIQMKGAKRLTENQIRWLRALHNDNIDRPQANHHVLKWAKHVAEECLISKNKNWSHATFEFLVQIMTEPRKRVSERQIDWLLRLHDDAKRYTEIDGVPIWYLIIKAYESRLDLDDDDRLWLVAQWEVRPTGWSRYDIERIRRFNIRLRWVRLVQSVRLWRRGGGHVPGSIVLSASQGLPSLRLCSPDAW
jgi:hypothetical protein